LPTKDKNLDIFKIRKNNLDIINISKSIFKNLLKNEI